MRSDLLLKLNYVIPILLGLTVLIWSWPWTKVLFGLDSYGFFLNPFGTNFSPLILYSYRGSWSQIIIDSSAFFYIDVMSYFLLLFLSPPFVERVFMFLAVFTGTFGVFRLLSTINQVNGKNRHAHLIPKTLASLFFIANPFTLSISLWHFEGWSIFIIILPYWFSTMLELIYFEHVSFKRFLQTVLLSIFLAPGLSGPYAVSSFYLLAFTFFILIIHFLRRRMGRVDTVKRIFLLSILGLTTLIWINLPAYQVNFITDTNSVLLPSSLISTFYSNSQFSNVFHILSLTAFGWLYSYPATYGWGLSFNNLLIDSSFFLILLFLLGIYCVRKIKAISFFYLVAIPAIIISSGSNFPFGSLNYNLLLIGGPFLIITNAYYFIGQIYVVSLVVVIFAETTVIMEWLHCREANHVEDLSKKKIRRIKRFMFNCHRHATKKNMLSVTAILLVILLITIFWYPLLTDQEYQQNYSQIDRFSLPKGFTQMSAFLRSDFTTPIYFVLVLPMSDYSAYQFQFDNGSFVDSTSLFSLLSPYPIIATSTSSLEIQLDDFLASGKFSNLIPVFQALHIKYIVFNPYYPTYSNSMTEAPNGLPVDLRSIRSDLQTEVGQPINFGSISVFTIPNPIPLVYGTLSPTILHSNNFQTYLSLLSHISDNRNNMSTVLLHSMWTNNTSISTPPSSNVASIYPFNGLHFSAPFFPRNNIFEILNNNTIVNSTNGGAISYCVQNSSINVSSPTLYNMKRNDTYNTSMSLSPGGLENGLDSYNNVKFSDISSTNGSYILEVSFDLVKFMDNKWNYFGIKLSNNNSSLAIEFNVNVSQNAYYFNEVASHCDTNYGWVNSGLNKSYFQGNLTMYVYVNKSSFNFVLLNHSNRESYISRKTFFVPSMYERNAGYNTEEISRMMSAPHYNVIKPSINFVNPQIVLKNFTVFSPFPIEFFLIGNLSKQFISPLVSISYSYQGNIHLSLRMSPSEPGYIILGYENSNLWTSLNGGINVQKIDFSTFVNVYVVHSLSRNISVVLGMPPAVSEINSWLSISWIEVLIITTYILIDKVYYWRKRGRSLPRGGS